MVFSHLAVFSKRALVFFPFFCPRSRARVSCFSRSSAPLFDRWREELSVTKRARKSSRWIYYSPLKKRQSKRVLDSSACQTHERRGSIDHSKVLAKLILRETASPLFTPPPSIHPAIHPSTPLSIHLKKRVFGRSPSFLASIQSSFGTPFGPLSASRLSRSSPTLLTPMATFFTHSGK